MSADVFIAGDKALLIALRALTLAALAAAGYPSIPVLAGYQPTQQGSEGTPYIHLWSDSDDPYGSPITTSAWNPTTEKFDTTTDQVWIYAVKFQAFAIQDPADLTGPTAKDFARIVRHYLQQPSIIDQMLAQGFSILKPSGLTNVPILNDLNRFEYTPTFTVRATGQMRIQDGVPRLVAVNNDGIHGV